MTSTPTITPFGPAAAEPPGRRIRRLTRPAVAVAAVGGLAVTLASEVPAIAGVMTFNHNEVLLRPDRRR